MRHASKTIKRATQLSAEKAMNAHIDKMIDKGWKVDHEFSGNAYLQYEYITWFFKSNLKRIESEAENKTTNV